MISAVVILIACGVGGYLIFSNRVASSTRWQAMVTPLASIMGSGFLVSAPLLGAEVGVLAVICMAGLLTIAYMVGSAIRFNIRYFEPIEGKDRSGTQSIAFMSRLVLAGAYFISISYYLKLLAAFLLNPAGIESDLIANLVTSALLLLIAGVGMWRGLASLGKLEKYAVGINLGMIAALLVALAIYNLQLLADGEWVLPAIDSGIDDHGIRVLLGLLIVVQGFEASRYLGDQFSAEMRIATMRQAQILSAVIYLIFISLTTVLFDYDMGIDITAIIEVTRPVAVVLPILLTVAAIGSQFSAAVADTEGAGGLIEEISGRRMTLRFAYGLILVATLFLTWETDVTAIIAYASRAFALYYALQCLAAATLAWRKTELPHRLPRCAYFFSLSCIALLVFALGIPAE